MALSKRNPHVDSYVKHTNTYDNQYDVKNAENEGDVGDYFPKDEFDESNTSNNELSSDDDNDEELINVNKAKKTRKKELNNDLVTGKTKGLHKGKGLLMQSMSKQNKITKIMVMLRAMRVDLNVQVMGDKEKETIKPKTKSTRHLRYQASTSDKNAWTWFSKCYSRIRRMVKGIL